MKFDKGFIKEFLKISFPMMISQLLANLVNMADTVMLGTLSEKAISGVSVANRTFFIYSLTLFGLTNGIGLFISQYYGANKRREMNQIFRFGIILCCIVCVLALSILLIYPEQIVKLFVKDIVTISYAMEYIVILRWTFIPFAISSISGVAFRVIGQTKVSMYTGILAFVSNVSLNYILIFGKLGFPTMGIRGAAYATLIARVIEALFLVCLLNSSYSLFRFNQKLPLLEVEKAWQILITSIPLIMNEVIWSLGLSLNFMNYSYVGEQYLPALTVTDNISNLVFVMFSGGAAAIGIFVGKKLGAGEVEEAKENAKKMIVISLGIYIVGGILIICTSSYTPLIYSLDGEILRMASFLLIIKACFAWTQGYSNSIYNILRSGGDTNGVFMLDGLFTCLGPVLISTILSRVFHTRFIILYIVVESLGLLKVFLATYFYRRGKWVRNLT